MTRSRKAPLSSDEAAMVKRIVAEVVGMDDRGVTKGEADVRPVLDCYADADCALSSGTTGH